MPGLAERAYLLLPLLAAGLYPLAALALKSATARGFDFSRVTVAANWTAALAFLVFVPWGSASVWPSAWWPPAVLGATFFLGQIFTMIALTRGDISVATPLLGTKVVMVAFLSVVLQQKVVGAPVWVAAVVTMLGIAALQRTGQRTNLRHLGLTVGCSLLAALFFGLFDVLTQKWSQQYDYGRLVPLGLWWAAVMSVTLLPVGRGTWRQTVGAGWGWLALGVGLMTLQSVAMITTIGKCGDATGCNIVYGSRGLWSIMLVWGVGHWFGNAELQAKRHLMAWRLLGAGLIVAGITLVFV